MTKVERFSGTTKLLLDSQVNVKVLPWLTPNTGLVSLRLYWAKFLLKLLAPLLGFSYRLGSKPYAPKVK